MPSTTRSQTSKAAKAQAALPKPVQRPAARGRRHSSPWTCEGDGPLPSEDEPESEDDGFGNSNESDSSDEHANSSSEGGSDEEAPARAPAAHRWSEEDDLRLIAAMVEHQPFKAGRGATAACWNKVKDAVNTDKFSRGLTAIKKRVNDLLDEQKKAEAHAARLSGATEEVSERSKRLADLLSRVVDSKLEQSQKSDRAGRKLVLEKQAGAELRDAAMRTIVERNTMVDLGDHEDASVRERQGQRKRSMSPSDSDKENTSVARPSKRRRGERALMYQTLTRRLDAELEQANKLLEEANAKDDATRAKQDQLLDSLGDLNNLLRQQVASGVQQHQWADQLRQERREERQETLELITNVFNAARGN